VPLLDAVRYTPDYLRKNPNRCVPTLEITMEDGASMHIIESGAMVALLAGAFPEKRLAPRILAFKEIGGRYGYAICRRSGSERLPS
jgi:glutathione S-transferase